MSLDLKSTLQLPDSDFTIPMKADLAQREPERLARWDAMGIYHEIQIARAGAPTFVLHDGPPYTNSPVHIGTALNKMLKDFVVKSHSLMGYQCPYVPGFDNHGLPIEMAVLTAWAEEVKKDPAQLSALGFAEKPHDSVLVNRLRENMAEFRTRCRAHAERFIQVQTEQFQRLGIFGLWENPYKTMAFRYEAETIRVFKRLVQREQVYKGLRPVMWSPTSRTALADTEIVYQEHVSRAIFVRFPLRRDPHGQFAKYPNLYTIIWTTTPWTIPANVAVAFGPELEYSVVRAGDAHYLLVNTRVEATMAACGIVDYEEVGLIKGSEFPDVVFSHPVFDRDSVVVLADYVTTEDGTGVVHTAPGHGRDDFVTGLRYNLPILCPVNDEGVLTSEAGEFAGVYYKKCDTVVVDRLRELGNLLHDEAYTHSYPHSERDGQPVIFRTTEQWFVSIDANDLRKTLLENIEQVNWVPPSGKNRIQAMVANRPDWCISRQRPWGVGIPVFYGKDSRKPLLDVNVIEYVAQIVEKEGSDAWFLRSAHELLPPGTEHPETGETEFVKETDVFDVWFDSGSTNLCVLEGNVEPQWKSSWPADVYLEGSDQHRGWFNTSLIIGTACRDAAPYKTVVTHGFVMDEKGMKMSKRLGNVVDPVVASDKFGADILRYWAASVKYEDDVPCGDNLLKQCGDQYRTIRNTLRFLLGNLKGYDPTWDGELLELDQWVMEQTELLVADGLDAYRHFDYGKVITGVHNFCANEISRFYLDAVKDRMYCDLPHWPSRRSGQRACAVVLDQLTRLVAPILSFTADEVFEKSPHNEGLASVHLATLVSPSRERLDEIAGNARQAGFAALIEFRGEVFGAFEAYKGTDGIKDSQDASVAISCDAATCALLTGFGEELANYLKMSEVSVTEGPLGFAFAPSSYPKCERSRLRRSDVELWNGVPLTARDRRAMDEMGIQV